MRLKDGSQGRGPRSRAWGLLVAVTVFLPGGASTSPAAQQVRDAKTGLEGGSNADDAARPKRDEAVQVTRLISPNGRQIAYGQVVVGPGGEQTSRIVIADPDGTNRRALNVRLAGVDEVRWFGDDRVVSTESHDARAYSLLSLEGQPLGTLGLPDSCEVLYKRLAPDGRSVAFVGRLKAGDGKGQSHGLFVVEIGGRRVRQLLSEAVKTAPAWSQDSRSIAIGNAGGYVKDYPLVVIDVASGKVEEVGCQGVGADWSPDGRFVAFTTSVVKGGSWRHGIPLDGRIGVWDLERKGLTLVSQPGSNTSDGESGRWEYSGSYNPVWSPDGTWLAYQRWHSIRSRDVDEKREETWVVRREGSDLRKVLNHAAEVAWMPDSRTLIWVASGRAGRIALDDDQTRLGPTPARPHGQFSIFGVVTDDQDRPLEGVSITVARGWGTLRTTHPVRTDAQGKYQVHFDPAMRMFQDDVALQCAIVHASKPGYYEKDLCRGGRLGMAYKRPPGERKDDFVGIVYPGHPYRLDLVMKPAARLRARLVDAEGRSLAGYQVALEGENSPATNVLASLETDDQGRFSFEQVPLKAYRFRLGHGRGAEIRSEPLEFARAGEYEVVLAYDSLAATLTWDVKARPRR